MAKTVIGVGDKGGGEGAARLDRASGRAPRDLEDPRDLPAPAAATRKSRSGQENTGGEQ